MAEHLLFTEGLKKFEGHAPIFETFLGQAHIAGTGPEGKTCRECIHWCIFKTVKIDGAFVTQKKPPGHFGKRHKTNPLQLKKARCTRPILNKANRLIPHNALACRLFEAHDNPPPAVKPDAK